MEKSVIYDLLSPTALMPYREKLKEENYDKCIKKDREKLEAAFTEEQLKTIDRYITALNLFEEDIDFQVQIRTLNYGIKIGMQLRNSIKDLFGYVNEDNDYA